MCVRLCLPRGVGRKLLRDHVVDVRFRDHHEIVRLELLKDQVQHGEQSDDLRHAGFDNLRGVVSYHLADALGARHAETSDLHLGLHDLGQYRLLGVG
jgi:hypothetical protein